MREARRETEEGGRRREGEGGRPGESEAGEGGERESEADRGRGECVLKDNLRGKHER